MMMSESSRCHRLATQIWDAARVVWLLPTVEFRLRTRSLPEVCSGLGIGLSGLADPARTTSAAPARTGTGTGAIAWWEITTAVRRVNRLIQWWPFGDTCLRRCLIAGALMSDALPTLVIGVRRGDDALIAAHSWLMVGGHPVDPESASFAALSFD